MANIITQNPLILDTAATIAFTRPLLVKRVEWLSPATVGNAVAITDLNLNTMVAGTCEVALQSQILWSGPQKLTLPGRPAAPGGSWQVSVINSGKLLIWF